MKKITILLAAVACMALSFTSCQKEENDGVLRFKATFEPSTSNSKFFFKPNLGPYGTMTWGYDYVQGSAYDYPIYIMSDYLYEQLLEEELDVSVEYYGAQYYLDQDNSTENYAEFIPDAAVPFYENMPGRFWAFASGNGSGAGELATDSLGTYMKTNFNCVFAKFLDATGSCAYTDIPTVALSSQTNPSLLVFKQLYGMLTITLTLPDSSYHLDWLHVSYDDTVTNKIPLKGDQGVRFDAEGNPNVFPTTGHHYYPSNYSADLCGLYSGDSIYHRQGPQTFALPLFPHVYSGLVFEFTITHKNASREEVSYIATKTMGLNKTLNIQRAAISTLGITLGLDDLVAAPSGWDPFHYVYL